MMLDLKGRPEDAYGEDYRAHLLEQYKLCVEMANHVSSRRDTANAFFLSINTGAIAFLGLAKGPGSPAWYIVVSLAGIVLCIAWHNILRSFRHLNTAKFQVIHEMEKELPVKPFDAEWSAMGRGGNPTLYRPLSHIEVAVPWIFAVLYVALIGLSLAGVLPGQEPAAKP